MFNKESMEFYGRCLVRLFQILPIFCREFVPFVRLYWSLRQSPLADPDVLSVASAPLAPTHCTSNLNDVHSANIDDATMEENGVDGAYANGTVRKQAKENACMGTGSTWCAPPLRAPPGATGFVPATRLQTPIPEQTLMLLFRSFPGLRGVFRVR